MLEKDESWYIPSKMFQLKYASGSTLQKRGCFYGLKVRTKVPLKTWGNLSDK